jgi:hypothetical protein
MTRDEIGRLIAGQSTSELLRTITAEFGADPVPWDILEAGKAYGWTDGRTLGALALFLCWQQRETKRLLDIAMASTSLRPAIPPAQAQGTMGYDPKDPLYFTDHPLG